MDKSDVEMEDVIKQPQDLENGGKQTENDSVDGKIEADGKHSAAGEDIKPTEVGEDEPIEGKSNKMTDNEDANSEVEVLKIKEIDVEDPNNVRSEGVKEEDPNNGTSEGVKGEDDPNMISEGVKGAEDPTNVTSEGVKEAEDPNNVTSEGVKQAEDPNNVNNAGVKKAEDPNNVNNGVKEAENANNVTSEEKSETDGQHNIKSEADNQSKIVSEANKKDACGNGEQDGNSGENIMVDKKHSEDTVLEKNPSEQGQAAELIADEAPENETGVADEVPQSKDKAMVDPVRQTNNQDMGYELKESENKNTSGEDAEMGEVQEPKTDQNVTEEMVNYAKEPENKSVPVSAVADGITGLRATPVTTKREVDDHEPATPTALVKCSTAKAGNHSGETHKNVFYEPKMPGDEEGTPEEQAAFMRELESFYRARAMEFKPPRFYGQQLNCLKLWRSVVKLGGYDRVTGSKLWRQVGESFHPPKTCTTVSWTFRIFYEKALLEYERYKRDSGELPLPIALPDPSGVDGEGNGYQASGSGRARRDSAARAMQGWHAQRLLGPGEAGEPGIKDKNVNNMPKREKNLKSIGSLKQKRPNEVEHPVKAARTETSKQLVASVVDVGSPADWVKINVRETKECFEVYALVPGLLREEVRVQSDPAGRLVITGSPEQADNPWGITAFKKVVSLPGRIDPLQTSAVVSLHGRLFVRVPFEQANI